MRWWTLRVSPPNMGYSPAPIILRGDPISDNYGVKVNATLEDLTQRLKARNELPTPQVRRALRKGAGASQEDVAKVVGVTRQAVQLWEAGVRTPRRGANLDAYLEVLQAFKRAMSEGP
jgi:DNA-binding transcriptional regulator YiaG